VAVLLGSKLISTVYKELTNSPLKALTAAICASYAGFHLWLSVHGVLATLQQAYLHLSFALVLIFLIKPIFPPESKHHKWRWVIDLPCALGAVAIGAHMTIDFLDIVDRGAGDPTQLTIYLGAIATLLTLEGTRRMSGWALPIIAIIFIAYGFAGPLLPGALAHRGYDLERIVTMLYATTSGLAGTPLQTSASYVAIFVIFAAFLDVSGAGKFFIDWSYAAFGWMRGGPAKVAIFASAMMGTVSGSAVANVAATGAFTIPVMKKAGLRPEYAGAVEAAASSGGQIMPPVMGAAAFIMVEVMGSSYNSIMTAAILPGLLFFIAVYFMVDFEVAKQGIKGIPRAELPSSLSVLREGWHLIVPLVLLIYLLLVVQYTPIKSAFWSAVAVVIVSWVRPQTRMGVRQTFSALNAGGKAMLDVAMACGSAGIVVGMMLLTGLALRLSGIIVDLSGGHLFPLLLITMVVSLVLGMGLPTSAVYVVLATLVVPAMTKLGVAPMAAHMFALYFGVLANVTPPVAIASYTGATIAGANAMKTGLIAFRLSLAGFIMPFMWVYNPALLLDGTPAEVGLAAITATAGIIALAAAIQGYFLSITSAAQRITLFIGAMLLITAGWKTDLAGIGLILIVAFSQLRAKKIKGQGKE
jgi:TRAP transporter 4TM/12TM fusion protein